MDEMRQIDVVGAVIVDQDQGFLCAQRGKNMSQSGFWEFPGGKVEPGENPEQALVREIQEELGCLIRVHDLLVDTIYTYPHALVHLMTYRASVVSGTPMAKEHEQLKWVKRGDLAKLQWAPADLATVNYLTQEEAKKSITIQG
jgi:8-oxo-dGTP diphosphatase